MECTEVISGEVSKMGIPTSVVIELDHLLTQLKSTTPSSSSCPPIVYVIVVGIVIIVIGVYMGERGRQKSEKEKHERRKQEVEIPPTSSAPNCPYCGSKVSSENIFCPSCGKNMKTIEKSPGLLGKNREINNYLTNARGISRFALNATFFVALFVFGWIIGIVFYNLGKGKLGWVYASPYLLLSVLTLHSLISGGSMNLSGFAFIIWLAGLIHANRILSHYRSMAFQRIAVIDNQPTPTIDSQLEKGLILDKVLEKTEPAIEILKSALQMPGGDPLLLYLSGVRMAKKKLYREAAAFYDRALASTEDAFLARRIRWDYGSVERHLKEEPV
ncbi:MAG: hypothetical protein HXS44_05865 [Theionarchaea archaeon]|nr:hypothetical protein [Theionarchaea archaeon]